MKDIAHFEGRYQISPKGQVLNLATNEYLTPVENSSGVLKVGLSMGDGNKKQYSVHTLVAKHYLPNPYDCSQVSHKDGNKHNNHVDNLEWTTPLETTQRAFKAGRRPGYMSANDKELYLQLVLEGEQVKDIALEIGRRPETLHKMLRTTADRLGVRKEWDMQMKVNRRNAALKNLPKPKPKRIRISRDPNFKRDANGNRINDQ